MSKAVLSAKGGEDPKQKVTLAAMKAPAQLSRITGRDSVRYAAFLKTLPPNLLATDTATYNMKGYWEALGRPAAFDYTQPVEADGAYHAFSRNPLTGEILKKPNHPTFLQALQEDARAGYLPYISPDGRVFTFGKGDNIPAGFKPYKPNP